MRYGEFEREISGFSPLTTNNRMEMSALIEALRLLKESCQVRVHTDSQYLKLGITNWIEKWRKNRWLTSQKTPVKNKDLWEALDETVRRHEIEWIWVKGHSGHPENERCDALARDAILKSSSATPPSRL